MITIEHSVRDADPIELVDLAKKFNGSTVFYAESNKELWNISHNISFFTDIETVVYPEWDCDFYDTNSPSRHILSTRISSLYKIIKNKNKNIILTTPKAVKPLTIPNKLLENKSFVLKTGQSIDIDILSEMLTEIGFIRVNNATNYGDYAIRGDIVDIANIDNELGYRIDVFGDVIEKIKYFNLQSQISNGEKTNEIIILPTDEVIVNKETIQVFKEKTKNTINSNHLSIIDGIKIMNYIHYLPFFYKEPSSFFDFFKNKYQIVVTNESKIIMSQINHEIQTNYTRALNNQYNKYCYPEPKDFFLDL